MLSSDNYNVMTKFTEYSPSIKPMKYISNTLPVMPSMSANEKNNQISRALFFNNYLIMKLVNRQKMSWQLV